MPKFSKVLLCFILTISLVSGYHTDSSAQSVNEEIANEYIRIIINTLPENMGRFSVGTTGGDPDRTGDEFQHLIYGGEEPWTSYTTIRIGNENWVYGNPTNRRAGRAALYGELIQEPTREGNSLISSWQLGPIRVEQRLSFARSSTTGLLDTAKIEYNLYNSDSVSHLVGVRLLLDTMLGQNDGAPFRLSDQAILTDTILLKDEMPDFWQAFDSLSNPQVMAQGTLRGSEVTTPDRVYFTNWGSVVDGLWNFDFQLGRDFNRAGEFELDSAIALFWDQEPLSPNESRTYVSYYGLGGVTISPGDISVGLSSPTEVTADQRHQETFTIIAYIQNNGEGEARDVIANLMLPEGLKLIGNDRPNRNLGNLEVGETEQTSWQVLATGEITGRLSYDVLVEAINSESSVASRNVEIITPAYLDVKLRGPEALAVVNEQLSPVPMEVSATIRNMGGAAAQNVTATLSYPMLQLAKGEKAIKHLGTLSPAEQITVSWYLDPTGVSGNLPYSVEVDSDLDSYSTTPRFVLIPYVVPKVIIGDPVVSSGQNINPGDYFSVPIFVTNVPDFQQANLDLSFNPEVVEIVGRSLDITRGTLFVDQEETSRLLQWKTPVVNNITGNVEGIAGDRGFDKSLQWASGTLATIHFRAKNIGDVQIQINHIEVINNEGHSVEVEFNEQSIVIE